MGELGRPVAAETCPNHGHLVCVHFGALEQIVEDSGMNVVRVGAGEQRAFSGAGAIDDEAPPTFLDEALAERMPLFFPIVDTAPMHDHGRGQLFRQSQMADDGFPVKGNRHALDRNVKIFRGRQEHLASLRITVALSGAAGKGMTRDAVIAVGF